jgi:hypothetical protein
MIPLSFFKLRDNKAITLAELLISISLLGMLSVGIWSIDRFVHYHLFNSSHRAKLESEAAFIIEHITKKITGSGPQGGAIGNKLNPAVELQWPGDGEIAKIFIDRNANGIRDGNDIWIAYRHMDSGAYVHQLWYYPNCEGADCSLSIIQPGCLSYKVRRFNIQDADGGAYPFHQENYLPIYLKLCWEPANSPACGAPENPSVEMRARIKLPSVSLR